MTINISKGPIEAQNIALSTVNKLNRGLNIKKWNIGRKSALPSLTDDIFIAKEPIPRYLSIFSNSDMNESILKKVGWCYLFLNSNDQLIFTVEIDQANQSNTIDKKIEFNSICSGRPVELLEVALDIVEYEFNNAAEEYKISIITSLVNNSTALCLYNHEQYMFIPYLDYKILANKKEVSIQTDFFGVSIDFNNL